MKTMQPSTNEVREREEAHATPAEPSRQGWNSALVATGVVLALAAGFLIGFLLWGTDGDSTDPIVAGGGELTARQEQMVEVYDDYVAAWKSGDSDAITALFTPNGTFEIFGTTYRVEDGTLASYVERMPVPTIEMLQPLLVHRDTILDFHRLGGSNREDVVQFTRTGEVLITSHVVSQ